MQKFRAFTKGHTLLFCPQMKLLSVSLINTHRFTGKIVS